MWGGRVTGQARSRPEGLTRRGWKKYSKQDSFLVFPWNRRKLLNISWRISYKCQRLRQRACSIIENPLKWCSPHYLFIFSYTTMTIRTSPFPTSFFHNEMNVVKFHFCWQQRHFQVTECSTLLRFYSYKVGKIINKPGKMGSFSTVVETSILSAWPFFVALATTSLLLHHR